MKKIEKIFLVLCLVIGPVIKVGNCQMEASKNKQNFPGTDFESLVRALEQSKGNDRLLAIRGLGKLRDRRAVEYLIGALTDEEIVAEEAAEGLLKIGKPAVEPLIGTLKDRHLKARWYAAMLLGQMYDPRAVEPLIDALHDPEPSIREIAAQALGYLKDARSLEPLKALKNDPEINVRTAAEFAVREFEEEGGSTTGDVESLLAKLHDKDPQVSVMTIESLVKTKDPRVVEPLSSILRDQKNEWGVRLTAAVALGELNDSKAFDVLCEALMDEDSMIRSVAAEALGKLNNNKAVALLMSIGQREQDSSVLCSIARSLGMLGDASAIYFLQALVKNQECPVRIAAALSLSNFKDTRAVESLITILNDKENACEDLRPNAADALGNNGDSRAVEPLIAALADENTLVRRYASQALEKISATRGEYVVFGEDREKWQEWWMKNKIK